MSKSFLFGAAAALVLVSYQTASTQTPADAASLAGDWSGSPPVVPPERMILHIRTMPAGLQVTIDAPDKGVFGIPIQDLRRDGPKVSFSIPAVGFRYEGELNVAGSELRGVVSQGAAPARPLILTFSASHAAAPKAPMPLPANWQVPSAKEIRQLLQARTGDTHQGVGVVVGVIRPGGGQDVVAEGVTDPAERRPVGHGTVFAMDSLTKVFTGLLLADMAAHGEVNLTDPVDRYLPPGTRVPERNGRRITLLDLATHTAGLPADPTDFDGASPAAYGQPQFDRFLAGFALTRDPGAQWEYSNVGSALLGQALARRAGKDYAALVAERIAGPLGMTSTVVEPTPDIAARLAGGHDFALHPIARPPSGALTPALGLYSTADDLLRLLRLELGDGPASLKRAASLALQTRRQVNAYTTQALGWEVQSLGPSGPQVVSKAGGSRGYRAYMAFRPDTGAAVVVLSNAMSQWAPDDIGLNILTGRPLPPLSPSAPASQRTAIVVPENVLARYVGRYRLTPQVEVVITLDSGHLYGAVAGRPRNELLAETPTRFFAAVADAQVTFDLAPDGRPTALRLRLNGQETSAPREAE